MISVIKTYDSNVAVKLGGCDSCGCHEDLVTVSLYRDACQVTRAKHQNGGLKSTYEEEHR